MSAFLLDQLDYIFFFYGLAFLLLGAVCFALKKFDRDVLPWRYLGFFGITHGLNEWLDLFALIAGDSPGFVLVRLILMCVSFAFLLEFGRIGLQQLRGHAPGRWIFLLFVSAVILGANLGPSSANALGRYGLGFFGALLAALAFFAREKQEESAKRRSLRFAGAGLLLYAIVTGLVVPKAPFFPASVINHDSFVHELGIPVQLIRGILACTIAVSVWTYAYRTFEQGAARVSADVRPYFGWTLAGLALIISLGWTITNQLGKLYDNELRKETSEDVGLLAHGLETRMQRRSEAVKALADSPVLVEVLQGARPIGSAQRDLDDFANAIPESSVYLFDKKGSLVSASSDVGHGIRFSPAWRSLPFLKEGFANKPGAQFDDAVVRGPPVYLASAPVRNSSGELVGVVALRSPLDPELELRQAELAFLVDSKGLVVFSNESESQNRALWALPGQPSIFGNELTDGMKVQFQGKTRFVGRYSLKPSSWSLILLKPEETTVINRMFGIIITLLLSSLTLGYYVALQREVNTQTKLEQSQMQLTQLARKLEVQSITDTLTGVDNRLRFNHTLEVEMARSRRYGGALSLIMCDIDHFKKVNDEYGHQVGDSVLVQLARVLKDTIRQTDILARWGGEEFMVVLPNSDFQAAATLAESLRLTVELTEFKGPHQISCSFGVSQFRTEDTMDSFTSRVDEALYRAKTEGRNRVEAA